MFSTKIDIADAPNKIGYTSRVICLGSCFAENIGARLAAAKFDVDINPFGVLYNPGSIEHSIRLLMNNSEFGKADIFEYKGLWHSFSHSSIFSDTTAGKCLKRINSRLAAASAFLRSADFLLITLGTAWVFEDVNTSHIVSNCHKIPAKCFNRRRLSVEEVVFRLGSVLTELHLLNPNLRIVFSVSPIRHWKDGAHENNLSKSTLLLAIDELKNRFGNVGYFPAYEIQLDELRDYRFYASDMLHPSDVAVDYIWQKFSETYFDDQTTVIKKEVEQLIADLSHRPLHPDSEEYRKFLKSIQRKQDMLKMKYPFLENKLQ